MARRELHEPRGRRGGTTLLPAQIILCVMANTVAADECN